MAIWHASQAHIEHVAKLNVEYGPEMVNNY